MNVFSIVQEYKFAYLLFKLQCAYNLLNTLIYLPFGTNIKMAVNATLLSGVRPLCSVMNVHGMYQAEYILFDESSQHDTLRNRNALLWIDSLVRSATESDKNHTSI